MSESSDGGHDDGLERRLFLLELAVAHVESQTHRAFQTSPLPDQVHELARRLSALDMACLRLICRRGTSSDATQHVERGRVAHDVEERIRQLVQYGHCLLYWSLASSEEDDDDEDGDGGAN